MTEDINNQTDEIEGESRSQQRIKQLSDKVESTAKERDKLEELRVKDREKITELERENTFNSGFADILSNPVMVSARDHKDDIKAKVLAGMSIEDATFAILGKAGKLGQVPESTAQEVAGGSATTTPQSKQKEAKDMNQTERREILEKELIWQ